LKKNARLYYPKLIVTGASAYPRHIDYARIKQIASINDSLFMMDMAHISGLIAAGVMPSPFEHADIVTTTTHKSLRGPRGAMIFYRKGVRHSDHKKGTSVEYDLEAKIKQSVFPGHQGGPHNHTISALAVALKQATTEEFKIYQTQVLKNCQVLATGLMNKGYQLVSNGTDNHLLLVDLRDKKISGAMVERVLELVNIATNKNTVPGDVSAMLPGGIRLGTPAMTTRGLKEVDFKEVVNFLDSGIKIALDVKTKSGAKLADFNHLLESPDYVGRLDSLKQDVIKLVRKFPPVGFS